MRRHPAHFARLFPSRRVNSVYFDTTLLTHYYRAAAGLPVRAKVRIRWYGDTLGEVPLPSLEIKRKQGLLGAKKHLPCPGFTMESASTGEDLARLLSEAGAIVRYRPLFSGLLPVLLVSYLRSYWQTADGKFRVTIDSEIEYCRVARYRGFLDRVERERPLVIELKYSREFDSEAASVTNPLPVRMSTFSKYGRGIERTYDVSP